MVLSPGEIDDLQPAISDLRLEIDDLRPAISELRPAISELRAGIDDLRPAINDLRPQIDDSFYRSYAPRGMSTTALLRPALSRRRSVWGTSANSRAMAR